MKPRFKTFLAAAVSVALIAIGVAPATAQGPGPARPPSAQDFGRLAAIRNVTISPDGKHIAAVVSPDGVRGYISIWDVDNIAKGPTNLSCGATPERGDCFGVTFVKNDRIGVTVRQLLTQGVNKRHIFRFFITDLKGENWMSTSGDDDTTSQFAPQVIDTLPPDPKNILIQRQRDISKLNVYTGQTVKIYTNSDKFGGEQIDLKGEVRARQTLDFDNGKAYIAQYIRNPESGAWEEHFRWYAADREPKEIVGFTEDPNILYLRATDGKDKAGIYIYDIKQRKIIEPAFELPIFDALGVRQSNSASDYGRLLGFVYGSGDVEDYWVDGKLEALTKGLRKALGIKTESLTWVDPASGQKTRVSFPLGADVALTDWSDDLSRAIVVKSGSAQPAEYYLLTSDGKLALLGKSRPWFDTRTLGETRLVQYPARDGLMIPALLTTPNKEIYGPGPYPTIITPHGGPWSRDYLGWDGSGWIQYFASRGYAVMQPQYRGSEGWGQKLWRAGDSEWGQKMQDDKDDGVKWLISQKIADPGRVAMHGYSYGGYAAMAAAVRPNGLYQCAVAGAGVAELDKFRERLNQQSFSRQFQRSTINGLQPLDFAKDVSIPVFLYTGDIDTTVPPEQSQRFYAALKAQGKPVKYLELKNMGHQSNRWEPGQVAEVLTAIDSYLRTECGPGGL